MRFARVYKLEKHIFPYIEALPWRKAFLKHRCHCPPAPSQPCKSSTCRICTLLWASHVLESQPWFVPPCSQKRSWSARHRRNRLYSSSSSLKRLSPSTLQSMGCHHGVQVSQAASALEGPGKDYDFTVIMKKYPDNKRRLITSFYVDKPYKRKDFERKYANRIK